MRRIAAVVLPHLVCDLARETIAAARGDPKVGVPLAVLIDAHDKGDLDSSPPRGEGDSSREAATGQSSSGGDVIAAVDEAAYLAGVRPGQRVSEAMAYTAHLSVAHLSPSRISAALATVAEVALSFGAVVHVVRSPPGVWIDVTGVAHLFGGEEALLDELEERLGLLGFRAQAAIADGPRIAEALARHRTSPGAVRVAPPAEGAQALAPLSIDSLPLGDEARSLFVRLGVLTVGDFVKLPRAQVTARLGDRAAEVMAIAMGHDLLPLEPYEAPEVLVEETHFDDGVETAPQLLFVLRAMISRLSARLTGRAQAVSRIEMHIGYDKSIFRLRASHGSAALAPELVTVVDLPAPLAHEGDLLRAVKAKLEQIDLFAPAVTLRLALSRVISAPRVQLDLSRDVSVSPHALPALLSELAADVGPSRLGVLTIVDGFRPERRSELAPVGRLWGPSSKGVASSSGLLSQVDSIDHGEPTRLLPIAVPLGLVDSEGSLVKLGVARSSSRGQGRSFAASQGRSGGVPSSPFFVGHEAFELEQVVFGRRLDDVEWWTHKPASRDYLRVLLSRRDPGSAGHPHPGHSHPRSDQSLACEAFVYVDRRTREVFLQGWWE